MNKALITTILITIFILPGISYSADWKPLGKMNMAGMKVTIYVDKSSIQTEESNDEFKKSWVKFDLPRNVKSDYSDDLYRSREELYYFHCGQNLYTVTRVKLLNSEDKEIYDSGEFNPFSDDFDNAWKLITPVSGPDLVNTYVCKLDHSYTQEENVPEWMRKKETGPLESPSLTKSEGSSKISLKEIRWALRADGTERLVFDIYDGDEKISRPDNYKVIDEAKDFAFDVLFIDYKEVETTLPDITKSEIIKEIIISNDDENNGINIKFLLKTSPVYKVFEVENPGRLVIDFEPVAGTP